VLGAIALALAQVGGACQGTGRQCLWLDAGESEQSHLGVPGELFSMQRVQAAGLSVLAAGTGAVLSLFECTLMEP